MQDKLDIFKEGTRLTQWTSTAFQKGPLKEPKLTRPKKSNFRCRRKTRVPCEKPAEASVDWKPNGHAAPGLGIEPGLSGSQRQESTTTLPASPR